MPSDQLRSPTAIKLLFEPVELNVAERSFKKASEAVPLGGRAYSLWLSWKRLGAHLVASQLFRDPRRINVQNLLSASKRRPD
jgi:hypothetical protein